MGSVVLGFGFEMVYFEFWVGSWGLGFGGLGGGSVVLRFGF